MGSNGGDQFNPRSIGRLGAGPIALLGGCNGGWGEGNGGCVSVAGIADATNVFTTAATSSNQLSHNSNYGNMMITASSGGNAIDVHGAADLGRTAGKVPRKRARVSKRAPTTFLNTDAHNFRAMVQQFTGGPSAQLVAAGSMQQAGGSDQYVNFGHHHRLFGSGRLPVGGGVITHLQTNVHNIPAELVLLGSGGGDGRGGMTASDDGSQLFLQDFTYHVRPNSGGRFNSLDVAYSSNLEPQNPSSFFTRW